MKKNQKIITIVLSLLAVLALSLSIFFVTRNNKKEEDKKEEKTTIDGETVTPLVYKVTKEGSNNVIYLFGSMHLVNLDEFDFPKYIMDAYENSDYLAVEADIVEVQNRENFLIDYLAASTYHDGTTIKDHISKDTYEKLVKFLEDKYTYAETLDVYKVSFFESILSTIIVEESGISTSGGVDTYFLNKAKEDKKTILEVESYEFQESLINSFPDRLFELSIISMIDNFDEQVEEMKHLYEIWKRGNEEELIELISEDELESEEELGKEDKKLIDNYNYEMIEKRNIGMKDKFNSYFNDNKKVLFIVGAAHIVGEKGIANLLAQEGYNVVAINK